MIITPNRRFPGVWALLPTVGAAMIISAGPQALLNRTMLSCRFLVWVGLISFPLYLWHWPLLVFLNILTGAHPTNIHRIGAFVIALVLSILTYLLIERPLRALVNRRALAVVLLVLMMLTGFAGYNLFKRAGFPSRISELSGGYTKYGKSLQTPDRRISYCPAVTGVQDSWCRTTEFPTVALIGDSHADQMMERFLRSGTPKFANLISLGAGNCQPSLEVDTESRCVKKISAALDAVVSNSAIEYVIISSWNTGANNRLQTSIEGFARTFDKLRQSHKKIIYVVDIPTLKADPSSCVNTSLELREKFRKPPSFCNGASAEDLVPMEDYLRLVHWIKSENPDIFVYDPRGIICPEDVCKVIDGYTLVYADEGHISDFGGQSVINNLVLQIENNFEK